MADPIAAAREAGRAQLSEYEAKQLLADVGIPVVETRRATSSAEATAAAAAIGYPVVLKIDSADVVHKSDVGGVRLNLADAAAVERAFNEIIANVKAAQPDAAIDGVTVQAMAKSGAEVIVGMTRDSRFGPLLMFGLGGIAVEVLRDVSFRLSPLAEIDANEMIREIRGLPLLTGHRGSAAADLGALAGILQKVSALVEARPEIAELDLNPIYAYSDGAVAVDARVALAE